MHMVFITLYKLNLTFCSRLHDLKWILNVSAGKRVNF